MGGEIAHLGKYLEESSTKSWARSFTRCCARRLHLRFPPRRITWWPKGLHLGAGTLFAYPHKYIAEFR